MVGIVVTVPGRPPAKANSYRIVRVGRYPKIAPSPEVVAYEALVADRAREASGFCADPLFTGKVELVIVWHRGDNRRKDIDNIGKAIMDGLTKSGIWNDDSQVEHLHKLTVRDAEDAQHEWVDIYVVPMTKPASCGSAAAGAKSSSAPAAGRRKSGGTRKSASASAKGARTSGARKPSGS